jgi:alcohol dehydrogenase (cytochrome c)
MIPRLRDFRLRARASARQVVASARQSRLRHFAASAGLAAIVGTTLPAQAPDGPPPAPPRPAPASPPLTAITSQDHLDGLKNPSRWVMYSGDYTGRRHSPLTQVAPGNVGRLAAQWAFQADNMVAGRGFEGTPLLLDGVLYVTGNNNTAWAINVRTGEQLWRYRRNLPPGLTYGSANASNRGFAVLGDLLFMGTLDAHLIALDRRTGKLVWDQTVDNFKVGYAITQAPLIVKDKVILGIAGGDIPTRGFVDAYDPKTGERVWRFYTIPAPGEPGSETWSDPDVLPRGGGATWQTGSYDPELNLLYWGVGNPNPDYYGEDRKGDNLYTASLIALDADTGKLRWHFQFTPHDLHDWDSNHVPVLADMTINGRARRVVMVANRNGFFYTLDRETGEFLVGKPFTGTQWARELTKEGKPIVLTNGVATSAKPTCVPDYRGGTNFNPPSYDPAAQLFFVMARETCAVYSPRKEEPVAGRSFMSGGMEKLPEPDYSALRAIDPKTGAIKWEHKFTQSSLAGVMSTASGLVFAGDQDGYFNAFESRSGKLLWRYRTGSPIHGAAATTYMIDGRQFVLIPSGMTITAFALPEGR